MELVVKDLNEVNQFMEAVKPFVLKADISKNNIKAFNEISGEIVLGDEDSQIIKIHVTDGDQPENKYDSFNKGNKFTGDLNDSITNSPDLPNKININITNNKPEDTGYSADFTEQCRELLAKAFNIGLSELDDEDN